MSSKEGSFKEVNVTTSDSQGHSRVVMTIRMCLGKISEETGQCLECGAWPTSLDGTHEQRDEGDLDD